MGHETARGCAFGTRRLLVGDWHHLADRHGLELVDVVASVLTAATTSALPPAWYGDYDDERARRWIEARDADSPTLLVVERATAQAIGLLILFEVDEPGRRRGADLRLGYVLAEHAWGRGLAGELVQGLVGWATSEPSLGSISGGVAAGNEASARVLRRNGFEPAERDGDERIHRLILDRGRADPAPGAVRRRS